MDPDHLKGGGWKGLDDDETVSDAQKTDRDVKARLVIAIVALLAAVVFVVQNGNRVETDFLFFSGRQRLWVVILVSMVLGALLGQAAGILFRRRRKD